MIGWGGRWRGRRQRGESGGIGGGGRERENAGGGGGGGVRESVMDWGGHGLGAEAWRDGVNIVVIFSMEQ